MIGRRVGFHRILIPFSSRNYRLYFSGQGFSLIGTWMTQTATVWLVYYLTKSPLWLGSIAFVSQAPSLIIGPFAGVWVDRLPPLRMLKVTQFLSMLQSFVLAGLTLTHHITIHYLLILATFQGAVNAVDIPTRQALVGLLAEKKEDLAGFIIAAYGSGGCFLIDGFSYLAVLLALMLMRLKERNVPIGKSSIWTEMRQGFQYAFGSSPIRTLIVLTGSLSLFSISYSVLVPVYAREIFSGDARTLGFLMSSSAAGSVLAAIYLTSRKKIAGLGRVICFGISLTGIALLVFANSRSLLLSTFCLLLVGMGTVLALASCNTLVQHLVDGDKRGRTMALFGMAFMGGMPVGSFIIGAFAEKFGVVPAVCFNALACWMLAWWFSSQLSKIREEARAVLEKANLIDPQNMPTIN